MGQLASLAQRMDFGVGLAGADVPAFADDLAIANDDATDARIGMGGIDAFARQLEGAGLAGLVAGGNQSFDGSRARRSISSRNSLRSWKRR